MKYEVVIKKDAQKVLAKLPAKIRKNIEDKIEALAEDPYSVGEKMGGFDDRYKFRQGGYRVIYEIEDDRLVITVIKVGSRGDVYKAGGG